MNEIKGKILSIAGFTAIAAFNVVDNKKPDVSNLVQKANYVAKYKSKYFTASDYNKFTNDIRDAKTKNKKIVNLISLDL